MVERDPDLAEEVSYWPSLADAMSAAALVLLLFLLLSFVQAVDVASMQSRIKSQVSDGLRVEEKLLQELEQVIAQSVGPDKVSLNLSDLNLNIDGEVFFPWNETEINRDSYPLLDKLADAFASVLEQEKYRERISAILIEGHCDTTGSAKENWRISVGRAVAVVDYLHKANPILASKYPGYFGAAGYSKFRPPDTTRIDGPVSSEELARLSRRIEIRIIPRHEIIVQEVRRLIYEWR